MRDKISVGQFYETKADDEFEDGIYLLCQVGVNTVCLVNIETGNRWTDNPVKVHSAYSITGYEWLLIREEHNVFTRITNKHIIEITNL